MSKKVLATLVVLAGSAHAEPTPLEGRARDVCSYLKADPKGMETLFNDAFMAKVGKEKLFGVVVEPTATTGDCTAATVTKAASNLRGEVAFTMNKGKTIPASLVVEEQPPHLISGLFLKPPLDQVKSIDDVVTKLK